MVFFEIAKVFGDDAVHNFWFNFAVVVNRNISKTHHFYHGGG